MKKKPRKIKSAKAPEFDDTHGGRIEISAYSKDLSFYYHATVEISGQMLSKAASGDKAAMEFIGREIAVELNRIDKE